MKNEEIWGTLEGSPFLRNPFLICFIVLLLMAGSSRSLIAQERTEYTDNVPYPKTQRFYHHYNYLNISLNGRVKSLIVTSKPTPVSYHLSIPCFYEEPVWVRKAILPEELQQCQDSVGVFAFQKTYLFSPTGQLTRYSNDEVTLLNPRAYDFSTPKALPAILVNSAAYSISNISICILENGHIVRNIYNKGRVFEYSYNQNGLLTKRVELVNNDCISEKNILLDENGRPVRMESYYFRYDKKREKKQPQNPQKTKTLSRVDSYCYDEKGNIVAHQEDHRVAQWMETFEYDSRGNMIFKGKCEGYKGDVHSCECRKIKRTEGYEYDEQNNCVRSYSIGWKRGNWDIYHQYDREGRETEYKSYTINKGQRTLGAHFQTTYDTAGRMVRKEALAGSFRMGVLEELQYDNQGNVTEIVVYKVKDHPFKIVRYQYDYDRHGNWIKRVSYEGESEDMMNITQVEERHITYYDE